MDIGRLLKWIVIIAIVFFAWKYGVPWVKGQKLGGSSVSVSSAGDDSCVGQAERASETWGSGLSQFASPPYDMNAWSSFRERVETQIGRAESKCGSCSKESCAKVRAAMSDLRGVVSDLDNTIRNGTSPEGLVQRQEHIDNTINEARDLQSAGK